MQQALVLENGIAAGILARTDDGRYTFRYHDTYVANPNMPAISLTLPKTTAIYESDVLFPFFYGLLAEGINKDIQCRLLKIDEEDDFTRLLKTADTNTIGSVTIQELTQ